MQTACAPVPPRESAIASGVASTNWKADKVLSINVGFEQAPKRTRFGNGLEMVLRQEGWFTTSSDAEYSLSYEMVSESVPKKFVSGSEGRLTIRYVLKDKTRNVIWSGTFTSSAKLSIGQSLLGAEGVSEAVEAYANMNLKQAFAALQTFGASLYDKRQSQLTLEKIADAFKSYDIFSDASFFGQTPYTSVGFTSRSAILRDTKDIWLKKLKAATIQNCQRFANTYDSYLSASDKDDIALIISQKKPQGASTNDRATTAPRKDSIEHKNPF